MALNSLFCADVLLSNYSLTVDTVNPQNITIEKSRSLPGGSM